MAREPGNKDAPFFVAVKQAHRNIISYALETAADDWYLACNRLGLTQAQFRYYCENLGFPVPGARRKVGAAPVLSDEFKNNAVVDLDADDAGSPPTEVEPEAEADLDGGELETVA